MFIIIIIININHIKINLLNTKNKVLCNYYIIHNIKTMFILFHDTMKTLLLYNLIHWWKNIYILGQFYEHHTNYLFLFDV